MKPPEISKTLLRDLKDSQHARWAEFIARCLPMMRRTCALSSRISMQAEIIQGMLIAHVGALPNFTYNPLKCIRSAHGLSQAQLAKRSGIGLRSIQMYEQRNKDINRAEAGSLLKLARALGCEMEDLLEPQGKGR